MKDPNISSRVLAMCSSERIPNSVLLEGRDIALRDASALFLAAAAVCEGSGKPCRVCAHCRKVFAGIHPDVTTVQPKDKEKYIKVDDIRTLRTNAFLRPNEANARVFLIKNAETMNDEAQNALLKLLEEPPETVCLILTTVSRSRLLSTVRSRLSLINVDAESDLKNLPLQPLALTLVSRFADKDGYGILKTLTDITSDRTAAAAIFFDTRTALMRAVSEKNDVTNENDNAVCFASSHLTTDQLLRLCAWCDEAVDRMNANANKTLSATALSVDAGKILGI